MSFRKVISTVVPVALLTIIAATGCGVVNDYTGSGTITSHHSSGKNCLGTITTDSGETKDVTFGNRYLCDSLKDGQSVRFEKGFYQK